MAGLGRVIISNVLSGKSVVVNVPGLGEAEPTAREIEIRANKRWLAKRSRELLGKDSSIAETHELAAINMAIKALNEPENGPKLFRERLKNRLITIVGGVGGGSGASTVYTVVTPPRRKRLAKPKYEPNEFNTIRRTPGGGVYIPLGATGALIVEKFMEALRESGSAVQMKHSARNTGPRKRTPPKNHQSG